MHVRVCGIRKVEEVIISRSGISRGPVGGCTVHCFEGVKGGAVGCRRDSSRTGRGVRCHRLSDVVGGDGNDICDLLIHLMITPERVVTLYDPAPSQTVGLHKKNLWTCVADAQPPITTLLLARYMSPPPEEETSQ